MARACCGMQSNDPYQQAKKEQRGFDSTPSVVAILHLPSLLFSSPSPSIPASVSILSFLLVPCLWQPFSTNTLSFCEFVEYRTPKNNEKGTFMCVFLGGCRTRESILRSASCKDTVCVRFCFVLCFSPLALHISLSVIISSSLSLTLFVFFCPSFAPAHATKRRFFV